MFGNTGDSGNGNDKEKDNLDGFLDFLSKSVQEAKEKAQAQEGQAQAGDPAQAKNPGGLFGDAELKKLVQDVQQDAADTAMFTIVDMVANIYTRFIDKKVPPEYAAAFTMEFLRAMFGMFVFGSMGKGRGGLGGLG